MTGSDAQRSAALLFADELADGRATPEDIRRPEVARAVAPRRVPRAPVRLAQRVALKAGRLSHARHVVAPAVAARRAVLGAQADGPPKVLVRVDELPHWRTWEEPELSVAAYERFHTILTEAGVPYLLAVVPRVARRPGDPDDAASRPLDDEEVALLRRLRADGVAFAVHGLDHRTRDADPRRYSELGGGLGPAALAARLDEAAAVLAGLGLDAATLVPPFNTFDVDGWEAMAERFAVVTGGPESVRTIGFQPTPAFRGEAVYLPAYAPFYAHAALVRPAVEALADARAALWTPVVLHWGWEHERGWEDLERLCELLGGDGLARPWDDFLAACARARGVVA